MKTIARLGFVALFAVTLSAASAPVPTIDSFETVTSVTTVNTVTISGSVGIDL